jgi:hypothetical protein
VELLETEFTSGKLLLCRIYCRVTRITVFDVMNRQDAKAPTGEAATPLEAVRQRENRIGVTIPRHCLYCARTRLRQGFGAQACQSSEAAEQRRRKARKRNLLSH